MIKFIRSMVEKRKAAKAKRVVNTYFHLISKSTPAHFRFYRGVANDLIDRNSENPEIMEAWIESTQALVKYFAPVFKFRTGMLNIDLSTEDIEALKKAFAGALNELLSEEKIPESQP